MSTLPAHTSPGALAAPLVLQMLPPPAAWTYAATTSWENYANGDYQQSVVQKEISLLAQANPGGYALTFETRNPAIHEPKDAEALKEMALRLAGLYARVVVQAAPTGEVQALLNHEELLRNWTRLAAELRAGAVADDAVTTTILAFLERQLVSPANVLRSLHRDYLYQTLVPDIYAQPLAELAAVARRRQFASFFDGIPLWFTEQVEVLPAAPHALSTVQLRGTLDAQKTDLTAVKAVIGAALRQAPAAAPLPAVLPEPHFYYAATYTLDALSALPCSAELQVYARAGQLYNKEYNLTLNRL